MGQDRDGPGQKACLTRPHASDLERGLQHRSGTLFPGIILCRNVLIYQDQENRRGILKRLAQHLTEDGILVLGCAEANTNLPEIYEMQTAGDAITYKLTPAARGKPRVA